MPAALTDLGLLQESLLKVHIVETASEVHNQRRIAQKAFEGMTADWEPTGDAGIDRRNEAARKKLDFELRHYLALELDGSGGVGFGDILAMLASWGPCGASCPEDLNGNGQVDFADVLLVISDWGPC